MKKFTLLFCMSLFLLNLATATNGNREDLASNGQPAPKQQEHDTSASIPGDPSAARCNKETGEEKTMIVGCNLATYQSATILGAGDFPYTSGTGVTVNASTNVGTLANQDYSCNGNSFSTAPIAWWINTTEHFITLTFSAPVTNFSMVMNGCNSTEVFTFTPTTGTVSLNNFCTAAFEVIGAGNQLRCNASGTNGTLVTINNPTGSTQYTITHNGLLAGSRISLLDCYVGDPAPVVDPESNVQACGTETVPQITFTGTAGATFNWTNNNTAIGLASNGTGNIASFTASNVSSQQVATITVTPVLGAQTGTPITFTITVKPKPTLTLGTIMGPVTCGGFNGSIAFTTTNLPNGIYSLTYTGPGSPQNVIVSGNAFLLSGRSAGSYSNFSITNNACTGTAAGPVNLTDPSYTWYRDLDGDTFGNPAVTQTSCTQPVGYVANNTDCDDNDPLEKPGQVWYDDTDNDGHGQTGAATITQCLRPIGYKAASELMSTNGDCNDNNAAIKPGATEVCDGVDNDCDGSTDEGLLTTWYRDFDGDTFGNPAMTQTACSQPVGYVANNTDCDDNDPLEKPGQIWYDDTDNDGYGQTGAAPLTQCVRPTGYRAAVELMATSGDCNDNNAAIKPGATEVCDGVDNNCNGSTDEGVVTTYYRDLDGDTFGDPAVTQQACSQPTGYVTNNTDCNDNNPLEKPGQVWYRDTDNDGYAQSGSALTQCSRPVGYKVAGELTATTGDCNDNASNVNPGATEVCDGQDNNCNTITDENVTNLYYRDLDGDGFGNPLNTQAGCTAPTGYVTNDDDCNDNNAAVKPGATEICDGVDNDCDGSIDEGVLTTWYRDMDGDTFGNPASTQQACLQPTGYVANNTDCDDNDPLEKPGQIWYKDADGDDYSDGTTLTQCLRPANYFVENELIETSGDCNDAVAAINPAATEICDGIDNDCDGQLDNGTLTTYYQDFDGDGFGNAAASQQACAPPTGYVTNSTDCDDNDELEFPGQVWYKDADGDDYSDGMTLTQCLRPTNYFVENELIETSGDCNDAVAAINPAAMEICDGIDNDCDGSTDEGITFITYYTDADGDGYGTGAGQSLCANPGAGFATLNSDCNDNDDDINPGATETCDGIDNDCDGSTDEGLAFITYYTDADGDGYGTGAGQSLCANPGAGFAILNGDCNDNDDDINPGATEICDGIDNDCDGSTDEGITFITYYTDADGDGYGTGAGQSLCANPGAGFATLNGDCNDNDDDINPGATEICDGIDNDCDGSTDEGLTFITYYTDTDGDGYGSGAGQSLCANPGAGFATQAGDCNDNNDDINPAATEICDGIDNNCDGQIDNGALITYYQDSDGDGFGNAAMTQQACSQPTGYVANDDDCDDNDELEFPGQVWYKDADGDDYSDGMTLTQCLRPTNYYVEGELIATNGDCNDAVAAINPAAAEICDEIDNNCDGSTDEGVQTTYYRDLDGDTFGDATNTTMACSLPTGYVTNNTDCDDTDPLEKPGQVWYADTDNDGYSSGTTLTQCLRPAGYKVAAELIAITGDCNDNASAINPAASEVCDGIDNNCDGQIDNGVLTTYYRDMDGDTFGDPANTTTTCSLPTGYVTNNTDCDDNDALEKLGQTWYADADNDGYSTGIFLIQCLRPAGFKVATELTATIGDCNDNAAAINPDATEVCDGIDNNCDGQIDNGVLNTYYRDMDGDSFGDPANTTMACSLPTGYITNNTDCDDNDALEFPGQVWYADVDNDGYSSGTTLTQCLRPAGYKVPAELTATTGDCNDNAAAINPAATEICDEIDNNCDGQTDEGVQTTYYRDMDGDGFGNPANTTMACSLPSGYVTNNTDCDDNDALEFPGQVWYADVDNDGYSNGTTLTQCLRPAGYKVPAELTATIGDCNDNAAAINPAATEVCDGVDNNCDGQVDNGVLNTYYRDMDGDGFGNPSNTTMACSLPTGYVANNTDCDDNDALEKPGQVWYADLDNDGYSSGTTLTQCLRPTGYKVAIELTATTGDCNDNAAAINPAASEICDGVDNDCDGQIDDGVLNTYYRDMDGDGFGNPSNTTMACSLPTGYVTNNTDCDDNDALEKPGQVWYADVDNDGYSNGTTLTQCLRPSGYKVPAELTATSGDCNDNAAAINPAATEICDGIDNDCDGITDEGVKTEFYADDDGDGYGDPNTVIIECSQPQGYVTNNDDCDDTDDTVYPGAEEVCDRKDNDCNGVVDDIGGSTVGNWDNSDVGTANGSANFPPCEADPEDVFIINSTGFSTSSSDKLHAVYQELCGNGEIIARVLNVQNGGWAGIMLRETLDPGSKKVSIKTQLTPMIRREIRSTPNGPASILNFNRPQHVWLRLVRDGSNFSGFTSIDGNNWSFAFATTISMNGCVYAGLFAESINGSVTTTATFNNVSIFRAQNLAAGLQQFATPLDGLSVSVYPNPTSGEMTLSVAGEPERNLQLDVTDALGRVVRSVELPEGAVFTYPLDLSSEPAGVYYLRLRSEAGVESMQRVLVQD